MIGSILKQPKNLFSKFTSDRTDSYFPVSKQTEITWKFLQSVWSVGPSFVLSIWHYGICDGPVLQIFLLWLEKVMVCIEYGEEKGQINFIDCK